ncbi:DDE-type integrase/transposase/recombinase [Variovorax sp. dw_954]|uniref:integrase catalytic domain-containing protein n=1 Tax=Variovorax sp. dw_954 TaxID=2720078 RepID=UPI001BD26E4A|nr:DDE-type integrase/transposase/recombinase [Variovorax sp. dw_954]
MAQRVQAGLQICRHGKNAYVGNIRQLHQKLEIHSDDGDMVVLTPDEFRREVVDGDIRLLVPDGKGKLRPVSTNWRENESGSAARERKKRTKILNHVDRELEQGLKIKDIVLKLPDFCRENELGIAPCERSLRDWRRLAKGHESMLSPAWNRCGNRYQGPDEILLEVIQEVVNVAVMGNDLFTMTATWGMIEARFDEEWKKRKGDVAPPRHAIKKLKNFLRAMPWADLMKLRMDGRTARAITRRAVRAHDTGIFWECVEMDATVLDILVRSEDGKEIGRPVLYVAIDVATGYIVGLHLTIQKASTLPFVECLRFMYFPKPADFDEKYGIKNRIEVFGKPVTLRVDNGSEFIGKAATELVRQLFGDSARCRPYTPQEKPFVERFNGILKLYILTLSGATTSSVNGEQRAPRPGETLFTVEELRGKIYRFVYDRYSLRVNELRSIRARKAVAAFDIWKEMAATFTQPVPVSREEFEKSLCFKRETRALGHDGIDYDGWNYHSDELAALYSVHGPGKYEFLHTDLDALTIYVVPPGGGELVAAHEKLLEGSSVDRASAKAVKKQILDGKKPLDRRTFAQTLVEYRELQEKVKSSRSRSKQARIDDMLMKAAEHTKLTMPRPKSTDQPTSETQLPKTDAASSAPRGRKMGATR